MSATGVYRRRLHQEKNGKCFWCDCNTLIRARDGNPRLATIDHIYDRFEKKTRYFFAELLSREQRYVLSCSRCNNERSRLNCYCFSMIRPPHGRNGITDANFCMKFILFVEYTNRPDIRNLIDRDETIEERFYEALEVGGNRYKQLIGTL